MAHPVQTHSQVEDWQLFPISYFLVNAQQDFVPKPAPAEGIALLFNTEHIYP